MTQTYKVEGMTCGGCVKSVTSKLTKVKGVASVNVDLAKKEAIIEMKAPITNAEFQEALGKDKFTIHELPKFQKEAITNTISETEEASNWKRLYPLFLIFAYLTGIVLILELATGNWNGMRAMQNFMGGFFVVFSFFKLLDLNGFVSSFQMYDPIAGQSKAYGYLYPFIELSLGISFLLGFNLGLMCLITLVLLGIGTIGVARTVLNKRKIQCACLGTVFNLPMTKVTIIENSIMIVMALWMLFAA